MGAGLLDADSYTFSVLSVPYLAMLVPLLALLAYLLFTRGDPLMRMALIVSFSCGVVFAAAQAAAFSCNDPELAKMLFKIMIAPVALIGPGIFAIQAAEQGQIHKYRGLLGIAIAVSATSFVLALATDLVVDDVWVTDWNMYFATGGPLLELHLSNMFVWTIVGVVLMSRRLRSGGGGAKRGRYIRFAVVTGLLALANMDILLAHKIGVYPMSWVPSILATVVLLVTLPKIDLIRTRGRDWATAWELLIVAVLAVFAFLVVTGTTRVVTVALVAPALAIAHATVLAIRRRSAVDPLKGSGAPERAIDVYTERCAAARDAASLEEIAGDFLSEELKLTEVRILTAEGDELPQHLDARVKAWILANRSPLLIERLGAERLGGLRTPIQRFFTSVGATVILPLVDRDNLVGVVAASDRSDGRAMSDRDVRLLAQ